MARIQNSDPIERLTRYVELLTKLKLQEITTDRTQRDTIRFLGSLGFTGAEITALTGISKAIVAPELSKARAKSVKGKNKQGKGK